MPLLSSSARTVALLLAAGSLGAGAATAQPATRVPAAGSEPRLTASAVRAASAPVTDGLDNDVAWQQAPRITGFRMFDPTEDAAASFATEARIVFDERNVYVFVRAFDPHPDSIIALLSRRDVRSASDHIKVMIDSYHDRRTAYEFAVNPAGVKRDYYEFDDSQEDVTWDGVWDVATRIDSLGWTAEFRIPLTQLRYATSPEHTFGIMIMRDIARRNERASWPVFRRSRPGIASQFADVDGFAGLLSPARIEVSPYVLTRNTSALRQHGFARLQQSTAGADVKYGLTSNLTLDATINPDFGQVEADPASLNLTAFELFLAEQRPFFREGTGIFGFGDDATGLFYSRRIGRAPQLSGLVMDQTADIPGATRILGAGKLSGRLAGGTSLGVLAAITEATSVLGTTVEPATSYGVLRANHDFRAGESALGVIGTVVHRGLDPSTDAFLRSDAIAGGLDGRHRFPGGRYSIAGSFALTTVRGSAAAMVRTQRSTVHYYQRPDDALTVDPTRESLTGSALSLSANKVAGLLRLGLQYKAITPGYESNDLGFLPRADQRSLVSQLSLVPSHAVGSWRNVELTLSNTDLFTSAGMRNGSTIEAFVSAFRPSGARITLDTWVDNALPTYCDRCAFGGPALRVSPSYNTLVNLTANPRLRLSPYVAAIYTLADGGRSLLWRVRPYLTYHPSTRVSAEFGARFQRNRDNTQYLGTVGTVGADSTHYLFAHLDQDLLSFTARLDITLRPTLSLQGYAEPFATAGHYSAVRQLATPRASAYDARFAAYTRPAPDGDFNTKQFNASAVLRWEYRPASTLFVVWTQGRYQDDRDAGTFVAGRDYRGLFVSRPDNVFLVKMSYWLGR